MTKEAFGGRNPSHFTVNPFVKAYIISESIIWSAWNFTTPIFAVFVINLIENGNVQVASIGFSIYLMSRVIFELITGRYLLATDDRRKLLMAVFGILYMSIAYIGFAYSRSIPLLFFYYFVAGLGMGVATPAKNALFSIHLDKNKEATEWGVSDAMTFICMAMAGVIGGFVAMQYGFQTLFLVAAMVNFLGIIPYLLFLRN